MDRNAYRDDNGTGQPRTHADPRETYPDERDMYPDERDTYPDEDETYPEQPETYWRRRAITLVAGLGVLGLLAWAVSGGGGKPGATSAQNSPAQNSSAQNSPAAGVLSAPASPSASPSSSSSVAGADAAMPGLGGQGTSGLPSVKPSSSSGPSRSAGAKSTSAASAAASTEPGGRCAPSSVVLSLFSSGRDYPPGQDPDFGVDAVSTAPGTCTFDLGSAQLQLVVMSAGRVIWDSADCAHGGTTKLSRLTRGVPVQESFTWNRAITLPGCVTLASSARAGSYTAQARTATITSEVYSFRLVR
jgi:hypothetical protein